MATEIYVGRIRSLVTHSLISLLTLGLYAFVWFFNINRDLRRHSGRGAAPAFLVVIFLIPVAGWFAAPLLAGLHVRRVQMDADADKRSNPVYPAVWGLVPVVGWTIAVAVLQEGANRAWSGLHRDLARASGDKTLLECPDCTFRFEILVHPFRAQAVECPQCKRAGEV